MIKMKIKRMPKSMPRKAHRQSVNHPWSVQARAEQADKKKEKENQEAKK